MGIKLRSELDNKYKWDLSSIIKDESELDTIFNNIKSKFGEISNYRSKLNDEKALLACLNFETEISVQIGNLLVYTRMRLDEDGSNMYIQGLCDQAEQLSVNFSSAASYIMPELALCDESYLRKVLNMNEFEDYSYSIESIIRQKKYILSEKEEKLLAESQSFSDMFHDAFNMYDSVDIKFAPIKSENSKLPMSHGLYGLYMQDPSPTIRKRAFISMFDAYVKNINTITQLYGGNVKKDCFYAKVRGYNSALQMALKGENVEVEVYDRLIDSVHKALPIMAKYYRLRAKYLSLKKLNVYDLHVSIIEGVNVSLSYEEAYELVKTALMPLGDEYNTLLTNAHDNKWIDVYENKNKRSGAYSWGTYTSHPYVLLNYNSTTHDVFTIAHELGHAMHSYYSNKWQPFAKAGYEIFVAEVASTVNEVLLLKHLMANAKGDEYTFLASYYMDMFRTTVFRQTQFAEFEMRAHGDYEAGKSITPESLSETYKDLFKQYYPGVNDGNDMIKYEWARIPHFYRSFYVYKYATGLVSAVCIANAIINEGQPAVDRYKRFLSLGGSMSPTEILKVAGVDLDTSRPYEIMVDEMERCMKILEESLPHNK